jgi:hypothetical protein
VLDRLYPGVGSKAQFCDHADQNSIDIKKYFLDQFYFWPLAKEDPALRAWLIDYVNDSEVGTRNA